MTMTHGHLQPLSRIRWLPANAWQEKRQLLQYQYQGTCLLLPDTCRYLHWIHVREVLVLHLPSRSQLQVCSNATCDKHSAERHESTPHCTGKLKKTTLSIP